VRRLHVDFNRKARYADFPSVSAHVFEESKEVFGCTAGGIDRFYVNHAGEVQPCEFMNISFGNVKNEPLAAIYRRMRERFQTADVNWPCCKERASITAAFAAMSPPKTPLPREETEKLVAGWGPQEEPPVYRDLKLYAKKAPPG
jgi:MoaA/NifB/PqqE/SkfB family radical SAM enzyme